LGGVEEMDSPEQAEQWAREFFAFLGVQVSEPRAVA
jgi:hypothetical protein